MTYTFLPETVKKSLKHHICPFRKKSMVLKGIKIGRYIDFVMKV